MTEPSKEAMAEKLWRLFDAANEVKLVLSKPSGGTFRLLHNDECIVIMEALQLVASSAIDQVRAEERGACEILASDMKNKLLKASADASSASKSMRASIYSAQAFVASELATAIRSRKP